MRGPPEPDVRNPATLPSDGAISQPTLRSTTEPTETVQDLQARSPLKLQVFCLARRFALSAPMAEAIAPLVYGSWRS